MQRRWILPAALVIVSTTVFAAARLSAKNSAEKATSGALADRAVAADRSLQREGAPSTGGSGSELPVLVSKPDAKQIRTGNVQLRAPRSRVGGVAQRVAGIVESLGGSVTSERSTGGTDPQVDLVLGVPPDEFRTALRQISGVATVSSSESSTEDVSGTYADLDGRVTAMRISVSRLQGFLAKATDVNQIASLEAELTRREADLESIQGQLDALDARITTSTLHVSISAAAVVAGSNDGPPSVADALANGWRAFLSALQWLGAALAVSLPFVVLAAAAAASLVWLRRRRRGALSPAS